MASVIDVCNLALAHLGETPNLSSIDPPEGSAHADTLARFYPIARDAVLERKTWSFALKRVVLAEVATDSDAWAYKYALPADCIRPLAILVEGTSDENGASDAFDLEGGYIYSNAPEATLRYIFRQTDLTKWTPHSVTTLSWLLASYTAGAVCEDKQVKQWAMAMYENELGLGAQANANARQTARTRTPASIQARA